MHPRQNKQAEWTFVRYCPKPPKMLPSKLRTAIVFPQQLRLAAVSPPQVQPQPSLSSAQPCGSGAWPGAEGACPDSGAGPVCGWGKGAGAKRRKFPRAVGKAQAARVTCQRSSGSEASRRRPRGEWPPAGDARLGTRVGRRERRNRRVLSAWREVLLRKRRWCA